MNLASLDARNIEAGGGGEAAPRPRGGGKWGGARGGTAAQK